MSSERRLSLRWLPTILAAALALRIAGIWYGLPAEYNSDEPFNLISALSFGAKKSLQPTYFVYPSLYSYFLFFVYGLYFVAGKLVGVWQTALDFGALYFLNPTGLFWVGRLASVLLGTAAIGIISKTGTRFFAKETGWLAAALLTLSYTHVDLSHWILPEPALVFFCAVAIFFVLKFNQQPTIRFNCIAAVMAGLAVSTKYNAGFIFLPLVIAIFLNHRSDLRALLINLFAAIFSFVGGFLIGTPYWLLSFSEFWGTLRYTLGHVSAGMSGHVSSMPFVWPLWEMIFRDWSVGLVFVAGFVHGLFQRDRKSWLLMAFALPTLLVIGAWNRTGIHYLAPVFPALAILAALFLKDILALIKRKSLQLAILSILLAPPLLKIIYQDIRLTQKDSRTLAQEWIEANIPIASAVAYENYVYGPNLFDPGRFLKNTTERALLPMELRERLLHERNLRPYFNLVNLRKDFSTGDRGVDVKSQNAYLRQLWERRLPNLSVLKAGGVEYILTSSDNYERYFAATAPKAGTPLSFSHQNGRRFYETVFNSPELALVREFKPSTWNLGPTIRIYKFRN